MVAKSINQDRFYKICVCGLGYVGAVTSACLARLGHTVIGVDVHRAKVEAINSGRSHFVEKGLSGLIYQMVESKRLSASSDAIGSIRQSDLTLICVGTPSQENGALNIDYVSDVCNQIGKSLRAMDSYHLIAVRSTLLPGCMRNQVIPLLEKTSGKVAGKDFGVCFNPEFLREGSAIQDFFKPSRTIIGEWDGRSGDTLEEIYKGIHGPLVRTKMETAEIVKYADNFWHALKVAFANEIGTLANLCGADGQEAMRIFALDARLNLSSKYLNPGMPFGGSCLPKDLRALMNLATQYHLNLPLLQSVLPSNTAHMDRAFGRLGSFDDQRIGILGLTFKPGTDDLRESPSLELAASLYREHFDVYVHDPNVRIDQLMGTNRSYLFNQIPDIEKRLISDPEEFCRVADVFVLTHKSSHYRKVLRTKGKAKPVIDLAELRFNQTLEGREARLLHREQSTIAPSEFPPFL